MNLGRVVGRLWVSRAVDALKQDKLLLVEILEAGDDAATKPSRQLVVAMDALDAGPRDLVAITYGSGARNALKLPHNRDLLVDAAICRIIEGSQHRGG